MFLSTQAYISSLGAKIDENTKLHIAIKKGRNEDVKLLLESGADVNVKNKSGTTALQLAVGRGNEEIVETILTHGADINSIDVHGRTPLHIACEERHEQLVVTLLNYACDISITDKNNRTPSESTDHLRREYMQLEGQEKWKVYNKRQRREHILDVLGVPAKYRPKKRRYYLKSTNDVDSLFQIGEFFRYHAVKMNTANLHVNEYLKEFRYDFMPRSRIGIGTLPMPYLALENTCKGEILLLKSEKISNTKVSIYDIFIRDASALEISILRNDNIMKVLTSAEFQRKFPIYGNMIQRNFFLKCTIRKKLFERGIDSFHLLFNKLPRLPNECLENIFKYLSDQELRELIDISVTTIKYEEKGKYTSYFKRLLKII